MGTDYQPNQGTADARNDPKSNRIDLLESRLPHMLDRRKTVEYTFDGTGEESFKHGLGKIPAGAIPIAIDKHANIKFNMEKSTAQRLYASSSVAGAKVTFLLL